MASRGIDTFDTGINDSAIQFNAPTAVVDRGHTGASTGSQAFAAVGPFAVNALSAVGKLFSSGNENEAFLIREMGGKLQAIENARQAGQISGMTASSRGRQAYQDIMMLNPQYEKTINEFFKGNRAYGIAESIEEASDQEESQIAKFKSDIVSHGFGLPTDSPEQQERSGMALNKFLAAKSQMEILSSVGKLNEMQANTAKANSETRLNNIRTAAGNSIRQYIESSIPIATTRFRWLAEEARAGRITPEEANIQANALVEQSRISVGSKASGLVPEGQINLVTDILQDGVKNMNDTISGKLSVDQMNNRNEFVLAASQNAILKADPKTASYSAVVKMLGPNPIMGATLAAHGNHIIDTMYSFETGGIPPVTLGTGADVKELFSTIDGALLNNPPEKMTNQVNGTLDSLILYGDRATNVTELGHLMDFLSGAGMRSFIQKGGTIDPARASQAAEGVGRYYDETVLRALKNTFINKSVSIYSPGSRLDLSVADERASPETYESMSNELVVLDMKNGLFSFTPKQGLQGDAAREARNTANEMNKQAVPLLNKLVKLDAHLGGNIDYQSSALRLKGRLEEMMYPEGRPGLKIGGMEGNDAGVEVKR